jgi:tetratricopeptide (TPR) repeat protein
MRARARRAGARGGKPGSLAETLSRLADDALAKRELVAAQDRYERWAALDPRAAGPHIGLARVAEARGSREDAEGHYRRAVAANPRAVNAWVGLADLVADDRRRAVPYLEKALAVDPGHPGAKASLAKLTGRARKRARSLPEALELAGLHPYDPKALLDAGERLLRAGRKDEATSVVALADLEPAAARRALTLLPEASRDWRDRRVVAVEVYADSGARAWRGWRFRQRAIWSDLSRALAPVLDTRFVVMRMSELEDAPAGTPLGTLLDVVAARTSGSPPGIVAAFRGEATPKRPGSKRGVARYLGRHLVVRDAPGEAMGQTLAHELLHLYGGIHILDDLESLMNPSGKSYEVDALNARIVQVMSPRSFGASGLERDVLQHVDLGDAAAAFREALRVNLAFRRMGVVELLGEARRLGPGASRALEAETQLDDHLGDVSHIASRLFWETGERVQAVVMLETAAQLYGARSTRGRLARAQAEQLRTRLAQEYGIQ